MLRLACILCLLGLILSGLSLFDYLTVKAGITGFSFCKIGQNFDCNAVVQSSWSQILGVPLASWGIVFYLSLFLFGILASFTSLVATRTSAAVFIFSTSLASLFSIFLLIISLVSIGKLCPLCLAMYVTNFALFAVSLRLKNEVSLLAAFSLGLAKFVSIPASILGLNAKKTTTVSTPVLTRVGILVFGVILFVTISAEDFFKNRLIVPNLHKDKSIAAWQQSPVEKISLSEGGAINADYSFGPSDAPIQIVEFTDFECPACRRIYGALKPIFDQYDGKIKFILKNYPLDDGCNTAITQKFHQHACYAASIARCAGEQGKFWEAVEYLNQLNVFDRTDDVAAIRFEIDKISSVLALDTAGLKECHSSGRQLTRIREDVAEGNRLKIEGTPAFWINGRRFVATNMEDFNRLFDQILKQ